MGIIAFADCLQGTGSIYVWGWRGRELRKKHHVSGCNGVAGGIRDRNDGWSMDVQIPHGGSRSQEEYDGRRGHAHAQMPHLQWLQEGSLYLQALVRWRRRLRYMWPYRYEALLLLWWLRKGPASSGQAPDLQ